MAQNKELWGEVFTEALPTEDPVLYGIADIEPKGEFEVRSLQTFKIVYQTGRYGLDDAGSIRIVFRFTADGGPLQTHDETALNYVTATSSNGVPLMISFSSNGHARPWFQALTIRTYRGNLHEGDTIEVVLGDQSGGSPGLRLQSMVQSEFVWRVLADVCATGHYVPVIESPSITIIPGKPVVWKAILPTLRRPNEVFRLGVKAEDLYGNPSDQVDMRLCFQPSHPIDGLPNEIDFPKGQRSLIIDGLTIVEECCFSLKVLDSFGNLLTSTNPMMIRKGRIMSCWADMHGQSGESVGINTAREYFTFARDFAFLDATGHQANGFQINKAFWAYLNELTAEFHEDDCFLTIPGYEWSGNTGVGGDRNVYFRHEGETIRRSSHALIPDRSDIETDSPTARQLFQDLQEVDCLLYAHIGGRPANIEYAHDPRLETAMEIHSAWGTFEWLMEDCFRLGHRVGVVANSDGHKGRPGASYPGASQFGAYGGLTCFLMDRLTRDDWFDCLKKRRHYATTGNRIHIDLSIVGASAFDFFPIDPKVDAHAPSHKLQQLHMGDIACTSEKMVDLSFEVKALSPIMKVDVLNAMEQVATVRNPAPMGKSRLRILWRGAMVKGRGARADWKGIAQFHHCEILKTQEVNAWNPDKKIKIENNNIEWDSVTAGNFGAFDVWLDEKPGAYVNLDTNHVTKQISLSEITTEDMVIPAGGMDLELRIFRVADELQNETLSANISVPIATGRDNPYWIRVTTEDGFVAWTSPVYLFRD